MSNYQKQASYYDAIYEAKGKNYENESQIVHDIVQKHLKSGGNFMLDVGCGTGAHLPYLKNHYSVEGLDISSEMISVAKERYPEVVFHESDMTAFDLGKQYDIIISLFSSIGYVRTIERLNSTLKHIAKHLLLGGVVVIEPWFRPDGYKEGKLISVYAEKPNLRVTRMNISQRRDNISILDFHILAGTPEGIEYFTEHHELGLFSDDEYKNAFEAAGLTFASVSAEFSDRGLLIGTKSVDSIFAV